MNSARRLTLIALLACVVAAGCGDDSDKVPNIVGKNFEEAELILSQHGLSGSPKTVPPGQPLFDAKDCLVVSQDPGPGTDWYEAASRGAVTAECGGDYRIPVVIGKERTDAANAIEEAGFRARVIRRGRRPSSFEKVAGACRVREQSKRGQASPGVTVKLWTRCKKMKSPADEYPLPPAGDGDDGLEGVPPVPGDIDCDDVDGPVRVGPDDPNRLDRDGDGLGCEWRADR